MKKPLKFFYFPIVMENLENLKCLRQGTMSRMKDLLTTDNLLELKKTKELYDLVSQKIGLIEKEFNSGTFYSASPGLYINPSKDRPDGITFVSMIKGNELTLKAFVTEEVSQVTFIRGIICRDGEKIAELVTKLYEVTDSSEFDLLTNQGQIFKKKNDEKLAIYLLFSWHPFHDFCPRPSLANHYDRGTS